MSRHTIVHSRRWLPTLPSPPLCRRPNRAASPLLAGRCRTTWLHRLAATSHPTATLRHPHLHNSLAKCPYVPFLVSSEVTFNQLFGLAMDKDYGAPHAHRRTPTSQGPTGCAAVRDRTAKPFSVSMLL